MRPEDEMAERILAKLPQSMVKMSTHVLEREQWAVLVTASRHIMELREPKMDAFLEIMADRVSFRFLEMLMVEKLQVQARDVPAGPWEWIKAKYWFSWCPHWLWRLTNRLIKPVKYLTIKFEAKAIYPDIETMRDQVILQVTEKER